MVTLFHVTCLYKFPTINKEALNELNHLFEVDPNLQKSVVYWSGVEEEEEENKFIPKQILGISQGVLPLKYSGVPLPTTRVGAEDCKQPNDSIW
ncbi:hypothetical protein U1Q18_047050 [Sarracenia purpurea var. burkii]